MAARVRERSRLAWGCDAPARAGLAAPGGKAFEANGVDAVPLKRLCGSARHCARARARLKLGSARLGSVRARLVTARLGSAQARLGLARLGSARLIIAESKHSLDVKSFFTQFLTFPQSCRRQRAPPLRPVAATAPQAPFLVHS